MGIYKPLRQRKTFNRPVDGDYLTRSHQRGFDQVRHSQRTHANDCDGVTWDESPWSANSGGPFKTVGDREYLCEDRDFRRQVFGYTKDRRPRLEVEVF